MNIDLIIMGLIFLALGYLVGVKRMAWLLSGFNEKQVKDKLKLSNLVGGTQIILGGLLMVGGFVGLQSEEYLVLGLSESYLCYWYM